MTAVTLLGAPSAHAATPPDQTTPPHWLKQPTSEQLLGVWPPAAVKQAIDGHAVIDCVVTVQGGLRDCEVTSERPAGVGFGQAALSLTPQFLFKPATRNGTPVEGRISIPVSFPKLNSDLRAALSPHLENALGGRITRQATSAYYSIIVWDLAPTVADVAAAYPAKARAEKVLGHAALDCKIGRTRALEDCVVVTEYPRGEGFGAAARSLAAKFRAPALDSAGSSMVGARTHLPFTFSPDTLSAATPLIGKPHWSATPTADEFTAAFPKAAAAAGVLQARLVLSCVVTPAGGVADCQTVSEDPPGLGFGAAAATLADKFKLTLWTSEGLPTAGGRVSIPIRYELQQLPQPAATEAKR